jgi:hypothetical protein
MIAFFRAYPKPSDFLPQLVAKSLPAQEVPRALAKLKPPSASILWSIPWGHHALLMERVHDPADRVWYMAETMTNGRSRTRAG